MMYHNKIKNGGMALLLLFALSACKNDKDSTTDHSKANFERRPLLENWADNLAIPALKDYNLKINKLHAESQKFSSSPTQSGLEKVQTAFYRAYKAWQWAGMYNIGKAEELTLPNFTNIYPTDTVQIMSNAAQGNANLALPSNFDAQGLPALDYLLFGLGAHNNARFNALKNNPEALQYLTQLTGRLQSLTNQVTQDWQNGFRDTFVNDDGASATASTNKMVNDYLFFYEKAFRAGKVGIPAGVFSGTPLAHTVEAPYMDTASQALYMEAYRALRYFFEGRHFNGNGQGASLQSVLDNLQIERNGDPLSSAISSQFDTIKQEARLLSPSFRQNVVQNNAQMLTTYDVMQQNVIFIKVDLFQALNIRVDFIDADGD